MNGERVARLLVFALAVALPAIALIASRAPAAAGQTIELHGQMAETGGWTPSDITASVGEPIHLRLTSDDVIHGFAIGQSDRPAVDVNPGEMTELTLSFDAPGKYTYYCTRWCGLNHWRMRGTIEVIGDQSGSDQSVGDQSAVEPPLYVTLGLDIDAPHPASVVPRHMPSARRGAALGVKIPPAYAETDYLRTHSPAEVWQSLRAEPVAVQLTDMQVWDAVALIWQSRTTPDALRAGAELYAANCAACHGESGAGDGVMAAALAGHAESDHGFTAPVDFTEAASMLGASPAVLHGKIVRGGMGTGMPYWGPIFTADRTWAVVDYLWTFQFEMEMEP